MEQREGVFMRLEQKYLLTPAQHNAVEQLIAGHMRPDAYGLQTIASIYYDTPAYDLARISQDKPIYKEKLRVRSYGKAVSDGTAYVELKKKYKGIVYKRRVVMMVSEAQRFLATGEYNGEMGQIHREIAQFLRRWNPVPAALVACERAAFDGMEDDGLRITFDSNVRARETGLSLCGPLTGAFLTGEGEVLMEIKAPGALPLWLARGLGRIGAFPTSFSKYGRFYEEYLLPELLAGRRQEYAA